MLPKRQHLKHRTRSALSAKLSQFDTKKTRPEAVQSELLPSSTVTQDEIDAWLWAVVRLDPSSPRAARYAAAYNVSDKIAREKAAGTYHATIARGYHFRD